MKDRIKAIRTESGLSQKSFAERLGISQQAVMFYESGRRNPRASVINLLCREFNINYAWIMFGEGDMHAPDPKKQSRDIADLVLKIAQLDPESAKYKAMMRFFAMVNNMNDEDILSMYVYVKKVADVLDTKKEPGDDRLSNQEAYSK